MDLFTLPTSGALLAQVSAYSIPIGEALLGVMIAVAACIIGVAIGKFFVTKGLMGAVHVITGQGKRGGRRRR